MKRHEIFKDGAEFNALAANEQRAVHIASDEGVAVGDQIEFWIAPPAKRCLRVVTHIKFVFGGGSELNIVSLRPLTKLEKAEFATRPDMAPDYPKNGYPK